MITVGRDWDPGSSAAGVRPDAPADIPPGAVARPSQSAPPAGRLVARSRHAYWLNPEPRGLWGSGDSAAAAYQDVVDMVECRTVAHLADFVALLLPS